MDHLDTFGLFDVVYVLFFCLIFYLYASISNGGNPCAARWKHLSALKLLQSVKVPLPLFRPPARLGVYYPAACVSGVKARVCSGMCSVCLLHLRFLESVKVHLLHFSTPICTSSHVFPQLLTPPPGSLHFSDPSDPHAGVREKEAFLIRERTSVSLLEWKASDAAPRRSVGVKCEILMSSMTHEPPRITEPNTAGWAQEKRKQPSLVAVSSHGRRSALCLSLKIIMRFLRLRDEADYLQR